MPGQRAARELRARDEELHRNESGRDLMTTGSEHLGNGSAKTSDRFAGQLGYRPRGNRDGALPGNTLPGSPLSGPLSGPLGGDPAGDELGPRNGASSGERLNSPLDVANPIASTLTQPRLAEPSLADLREPVLREPVLREPVLRESSYSAPTSSFPVDSWLDAGVGLVADHPMLRGLLLELPPKGSTLHAQWLDRWFEAARSILELLYRFED
jgi:hypothetical protein